MKLSLAVAVALIPYFVSATPVEPRVGTVINLTRRFKLAEDGVVNINALNAHRLQVNAYALPTLSFLCIRANMFI